MSQERLAELVGNQYKHIGQVERGEVNVGIDILTTIAMSLSVDVSELLRPAPGEASGERAYVVTDHELKQIEHALRTVERVKRARASPERARRG